VRQASLVKNLPAKQETWVQTLCEEDTLEKKMATTSSILAWEIIKRTCRAKTHDTYK